MLRSPKPYNSIDGFYVLEQQVPQKWNKHLYTIIEIDGFPLVHFPKYAVDVEQLLFSLQGNGSYSILVMGHSFDSDEDIWADPIIVTHHPAHISWQVSQPILERSFHFEKEKYFAFVHRMKVDLLQIIKQHPKELTINDLRINPYTYQKWAFLQPLITKYNIQ